MNTTAKTGTTHARFRCRYFLLLAGFAVLLASSSDSYGQGTLGLIDIPHGTYNKPGDHAKEPNEMYASTRGGFVKFTIAHTEKFSETLRMEWEFNKDVKSLRAGEEIGITLRTTFLKQGIESSDPYKASYGHRAQEYWLRTMNGSYMASQRGLAFVKDKDKVWHPNYFNHDVKAVYARSSTKNTTVGAHAGKLTVGKSLEDGTTGFTVLLNATAYGNSKDPGKPRSCHYEWVYLYRMDTPGKNVEVKIGNPDIPKNLQPDPTAGGTDPGGKGSDPGKGKSKEVDRDIFVQLPSPGGLRPPWLAPSGTSWGGPSRSHRPTGWQDSEVHWPPLTSSPGGGSGSPRPSDVTSWWNPGPPDRGPNGTNGAARILLADRRQVPTGEEVTIPIVLFYPRGTANLSFDVRYDASVVEPVEKPERGALIRSADQFRGNTPESGLLKVAFAQSAALQRSGIVTFARFHAVGSPGTRTKLRLDVTALEDPAGRPLAIDLYDGEIEIIRQDQRLPGDYDNDRRLTVYDAQSALDMDVRLIPEDLRLDMNDDGKVNSSDARIILQGLEIGAGDWRATP